MIIMSGEYMPEFDAGLLKYKGNTKRMRYIMRLAQFVRIYGGYGKAAKCAAQYFKKGLNRKHKIL